jgi:NAD(P)H-hydrate epimerase
MVLMERAGLGVVRQIETMFGPEEREVVVLSGPGNNGGDGLVVARNLHQRGYKVQALLFGGPDRLSPDCRRQYEICKNMKVPVKMASSVRTSQLKGKLVVDALLGTGLNKLLRENILKVVRATNEADTEVFAVDIPTGVSSDTGQLMPDAIRATLTVTFGLPKRGHLLYPGRAYTGKLIVEDIGFPPEILNSKDLKVQVVEEAEVRAILPLRPEDAHKGTFGHVLVLGGSWGKTGALRMTAKAALRSGTGLVTIATEKEVLPVLPVLEEMTLPLDGYTGKDLEEILRFLHERADILAIGPGLGREQEKVNFVLKLLERCPVPAVVDADGLYALSGLGPERLIRFLNKLPCPVVLTPHPMEMARLVGSTAKQINEKRIELAKEFSIKTGACLVLKGAPTVVASEGSVYINPTGNEAMATAGSGDVLTGILAGLLAQGLPVLEASVAGVYLHGLAGDIGAQEKTSYGLTAGDILEYIPVAFKTLL